MGTLRVSRGGIEVGLDSEDSLKKVCSSPGDTTVEKKKNKTIPRRVRVMVKVVPALSAASDSCLNE